jgi:anti-anti-sigma factor
MTNFEELRRGGGASPHRVIQIHGECGIPDVDDLQANLDLGAAADADVVIGLEHCEFIDSLALAALFRAHGRAGEEGRRLVLAAPTGQPRRVLRFSGLETDGVVYETVEEALAGTARLV